MVDIRLGKEWRARASGGFGEELTDNAVASLFGCDDFMAQRWS